MTNAPLVWTRHRWPGHYIASGPGDSEYRIVNTARKRWELITRLPDHNIRHGAAYTLREAREVFAKIHDANLKAGAVA